MSTNTRTFSLEILFSNDGDYALDLRTNTNDHTSSVTSISGTHLNRIRPSAVRAVTTSGQQRTVLSPTRKAPIPLSEDAGVRLALIVLATAPLRKPARVEAIRLGIDALTAEEALYWYAHCTGPKANRALGALRILLAGD